MKTIFRFIATAILLTLSYPTLGQSSQRHKIQNPAKLYADLNFTIITGAVTFAYSTVGGDDSFATVLTDADFEAAFNFAQKIYYSRGHIYMQYVEEIYADLNNPDRSWFKTLFRHVYIAYAKQASIDRRIPFERRMEYRELDPKQELSMVDQNWEYIVDLCVGKYLNPLLK